MKILQISHRHHIAGGSDAVFFATTRLLEAAGHDVIPFCVSDPRNLPSPVSSYFPEAADTRCKPVAQTLRYIWNADARDRLRHLIADHGPFDVAHLHIYHGKHTPAILGVLVAAGIPILHSLHEYKLACPVYTLQRGQTPCQSCVTGSTLNALRHRCKDGSLARSAVMWAEFHTARALGDVKRIDRFLCVSDFLNAVMARAGLPAKKLHRLHNFVEPAAKPGPGDGGLLYFGRIEELKGLPTLVDAIAGTGQRLTIAGDGSWAGALRRRVADCPEINFVGFKSGSALTRLIRHAAAVVVPSEWYENCPMSLLEAKAQGVPVIGARIGGIPELIKNGQDGFLYTPGDRNDLVRALVAFRRADRSRLASAALDDVRARFSPEVHLRALLRHYADVQPRHRATIRRPVPA